MYINIYIINLSSHSLPQGGSETRKNMLETTGHVDHTVLVPWQPTICIGTSALFQHPGIWKMAVLLHCFFQETLRTIAMSFLERQAKKGVVSVQERYCMCGVIHLQKCPEEFITFRFNKGPNSTPIHRSKQSDPEGSLKFNTILLHQHLI